MDNKVTTAYHDFCAEKCPHANQGKCTIGNGSAPCPVLKFIIYVSNIVKEGK